MLDAFTSKISLDFIKSIEPDANILKLQREKEVSDRLINPIPKFDGWVQSIINDLNSGKRVFIFYPYKTQTKKIKSMAQIQQIIESRTGKSGLIYNADVNDSITKTLYDVNKVWGQYHL